MITCTWRFVVNRPKILLRLNRVKFKTIIMVMLAMSIAGSTLIMLYQVISTLLFAVLSISIVCITV